MDVFEVNFDGLPGPTHNYSGLSFGNVASQENARSVSNPREALLQGLEKMRMLHGWGLRQAVLPPHDRPRLDVLRNLGFSGDDRQVIEHVARHDFGLLASCYSASAMWTANAATVSPKFDTRDGKTHFTPANLIGNLHRSLEPGQTTETLRRIFHDTERFTVHEPLPATDIFSDEGAANHTRLCPSHGEKGLEIFAYGRSQGGARPSRYPARQTLEASEAIVRMHGLDDGMIEYVRQRPEAIDAGVFHNDVIAVGNRDVLFFHEQAFAQKDSFLEDIRRRMSLRLIEVPAARVPLKTAVATYLFNSQLLSLPGGGMALLAPGECEQNGEVRDYLSERTGGDGPFRRVEFLDLRQSMRNGGGPACLRLRVVLDEDDWKRIHQGVVFTEDLYEKLKNWAVLRYRERLGPEDLADPSLVDEARTALDELTTILGLPSLYPFQRETI